MLFTFLQRYRYFIKPHNQYLKSKIKNHQTFTSIKRIFGIKNNVNELSRTIIESAKL